jgi:putative hydroxymethylpyrimidine transport system substrate-binding protein
MRRLLAVAALVVVAALLAAGCGEKKDRTATPGAQRLDLVLDYLPNADHVGIYAARSEGDFRAAGVDVRIRVPSDPAAPLKLLAAGKADLAISYEPELLLARDRGLRLVSVGAIVQKPLTAIISLPAAHVREPRDLAGKKVGTAGIPYQSAYLKTILGHAGVSPSSVREVNVGFNLVPAMLSGRVDATLGAFWNYEAIDLALRHRRPHVIRMEQAGVPTYDELVLVARRDTLAREGSLVRRFVQALGRGYAAARRDPAMAVDALVRANPELGRRLQLASVKATLPVFFPDRPGKPFGWQDAAQWRAYGLWMQRNGLLKRPANAQDALTNEFLAGQGI